MTLPHHENKYSLSCAKQKWVLVGRPRILSPRRKGATANLVMLWAGEEGKMAASALDHVRSQKGQWGRHLHHKEDRPQDLLGRVSMAS